MYLYKYTLKMISDLIPMTKNSPFESQKLPYWAKKAQNDPKIRPKLNSLNTGNAIKESCLFIYVYFKTVF